MTHDEAQEYVKNSSFITTGEGVYEVVEVRPTSMVLNPWLGNCWNDEDGVEYPLSSVFPYDGAI